MFYLANPITNNLNSLIDFIRLRLCFFVIFVGISGYLLFNAPSFKIIFVGMSSFFACSGVYAYNQMTDVKEDTINRRKINPLAHSKMGLLTVFLCFTLGLSFSLFLSMLSIVYCIIFTGIGIAYSLFRIKRIFLIKNIYTGFGLSLLFLLGTNSIQIGGEILYYVLVSIFAFTGSMVADINDREGDKAVGAKTIPVIFGHEKSKTVLYLLLVAFSGFVLLLDKTIVLLPFSLIMIACVSRNRFRVAHAFSGISFIFLTVWLLLT